MSGRARRDRPPRAPAGDERRDVREAILTATVSLLAERRFADLAVADILARAEVARASFYFYFESKYAVLAQLARRAVGGGHAAAAPWLERHAGEEPASTLRQGIADGARVWKEHAPVLRAVVENWRDDPELSALWVELMDSYTQAAVKRVTRDRHAGTARATASDAQHLAAALTWSAERLYYLAAIDVPPFDDPDVLVEVLLEMWLATLYPNRG